MHAAAVFIFGIQVFTLLRYCDSETFAYFSNAVAK